MLKARIFALSSVATLALSQPVFAQSAEPTAGTASTDDIIVTARRRDENLQDVPISISAISGSALEAKGISSIGDLGAAVPSLSISAAGGLKSQLTFAIRGQVTNETQILTDPPVGLYFAEVNQPRTQGFGAAFYDIQSVQVLKGVQGTLFGRNMTGGAVLVEPAHPTDKFEAYLKGSYGNYNLRDVEGMINVPLGEIGALRVAGKVRRRDGYVTDISSGRDYLDTQYDTFRASLKLGNGPFQNLTIFDYTNIDEHGTGLIGDGYTVSGATGAYALINAAFAGAFGPGQTIPNIPAQFGAFAGRRAFSAVSDINGQVAAQAAIRNSSNPYRILGTSIGAGGRFDYPPAAGGTLPYERTKNWGITNKTEFELSDTIKLKNIFGYRKIDFDSLQDLDGLPAPLISAVQRKNIEEYSEELQLQGSAFDNKLTYVLGGYYFVEKGTDSNISSQFPELTTAFDPRPASATAAARLAGGQGGGTSTTYAGFVAGTYKFSPQWSLSAGLRYTNDKREIVNRQLGPALDATRALIPGSAPLAACTFDTTGLDGIRGTADDIVLGADCSVRASKSWSAATYDATLQWQPNDSVTAYAAYRRGFRSGAFSLRATNAAALRPADPETVDEFELGMKNRFAVGGGLLTTSAALFLQNYNNVQKQVVTTINNVVVTRIDNVAKQRITGGEFEANLRVGRIDFGAAYSYTKVQVLQTVASLAAEFAQIQSPEHQANVNLTWHLPISESAGDLSLSGNLGFKSRIHLDNVDRGGDQPAYEIVNLRANWNNIGGSGFGAALFVNNLTKTVYRVGVLSIVAETGIGGSVYGEPRTYGLEVSYRF